MVSTTSIARFCAATLAFAATAICAFALSASASADVSPTTNVSGATGTVGALGADPTVRVAARRHCVNSKVRVSPRYTGGGGLVKSYLYLNSNLVATRRSSGSLAISVKRLHRGFNSIELISEFADGRAASITRSLRRCHAH